ncbi:RpiB/LacA/LacB family sugar-phosphate isomerase [Candidatus Dependentiae bacterium]|nr:RpiB/LacA/LacB family sugar-phosphate isomerase [Candidatus Dependentiae bacterium]
MKIIIGSDHRGYALKEQLKEAFSQIEWVDVGTTNGDDRADYPVVTKSVCKKILEGESDRGILICGSGIGVSIAANRFPKIYAALCWSPEVATVAREHDGANVLALPADFLDGDRAVATVQAWLDALFAGGRYQKRLDMID